MEFPYGPPKMNDAHAAEGLASVGFSMSALTFLLVSGDSSEAQIMSLQSHTAN